MVGNGMVQRMGAPCRSQELNAKADEMAHAANDQKEENTVKKTTNPLPKSALKEADNANEVQEDLDEQQESLRKEAAGPAAAVAAAAGVAALKRPSSGSDG